VNENSSKGGGPYKSASKFKYEICKAKDLPQNMQMTFLKIAPFYLQSASTNPLGLHHAGRSFKDGCWPCQTGENVPTVICNSLKLGRSSKHGMILSFNSIFNHLYFMNVLDAIVGCSSRICRLILEFLPWEF